MTSKEKILDKLVKIKKLAESEAALGNTKAAEAFAETINRMLLEYELNPEQIDYARHAESDPIIEVRVNWLQHAKPGDNMERYKDSDHRIPWQETLARIVSEAHLCKFLVHEHSDVIWFVGTRSHATVAEYLYSTLVLNAYMMARRATKDYRKECKRWGDKPNKNYEESWLWGFINRIRERFDEARKSTIKNAAADGVSESTALVHLSSALARAGDYITKKFGTSRLENAKSDVKLDWQGFSDGAKAADKINIAGKAVGGQTLDPAARKLR